jgi:cytochrome P450
MPPDLFDSSMINMDDPRHARLRGLSARHAAEPRRLEDDVQRVAAQIVDRLLDRGE